MPLDLRLTTADNYSLTTQILQSLPDLSTNSTFKSIPGTRFFEEPGVWLRDSLDIHLFLSLLSHFLFLCLSLSLALSLSLSLPLKANCQLLVQVL